MIQRNTRNAPVWHARRPARRAARVMVGAAVAVVAGLPVTLAAATIPALAAPHSGGAAASHTRPATSTVRHPAAGRWHHRPRWAHIAAGSFYTCGIRAGGTLWCWGYDGFGELGIGRRAFNTIQDRPRQVTTPAPGGWASIAADGNHNCAIRLNSTLWCWGANEVGQLGIGNQTSQNRPRQVTTPAPGGWVSVSAGGDDTCARRTGGTLWCWGNNFEGQLGIGSHTNQDRPQPVTTPAPGDWASITAGEFQTCGIRPGGTLWCWGQNDHGQLGIGSDTDQDQPVQVTTPAPGGWAAVTSGESHTCATRTGGTLWCWGENDWGQLGIGGDTDQNQPAQVTTPAPDGWASVSAGGGSVHTCATRTGGTLWCWGFNAWGQLGIGSEANQDRPVQVTTPEPGGWAAVSAGGGHTCAIRTGRSLWCWGYNGLGELGIGNITDQDRPQLVSGCADRAAQAQPARATSSAVRGRGAGRAINGP